MRDDPYYASGPIAPSGVGGWLLFLIVTMVVIGPLACIGSLFRSYPHITATPARLSHPQAHLLFIVVEQLAAVALYAYGIFAGIQLWKTRPAAVLHAKRFLLFYAAYHLADFAMALNFAWVMDPAGTLGRFLSRELPKQGRLLVYPIVWYWYLLRSKRVRNTFLPKTNDLLQSSLEGAVKSTPPLER